MEKEAAIAASFSLNIGYYNHLTIFAGIPCISGRKQCNIDYSPLTGAVLNVESCCVMAFTNATFSSTASLMAFFVEAIALVIAIAFKPKGTLFAAFSAKAGRVAAPVVVLQPSRTELYTPLFYD